MLRDTFWYQFLVTLTKFQLHFKLSIFFSTIHVFNYTIENYQILLYVRDQRIYLKKKTCFINMLYILMYCLYI